MRIVNTERETNETKIKVELNVDGKGEGNVKTGIKLLNHLLITLAKHSLFDLKVKATGDLKHHLTEDVALILGESLQTALGKKEGIRRFGSAYVPMDESLARAAIDLGGRAHSIIDLGLKKAQIEDLKSEDVEHFFHSFSQASKSNLHLTVIYGSNDHHKIEAAMKAMAIALKQAVALEPRIGDRVPSAKGVI